jgi:predicted CoA-binding protein
MLSTAPAQPSDTDIARLLAQARTIAVVGASLDPWRASFGVANYLRRVGYRVIPVNPTLLGHAFQGEPFRASLRDIRDTDIVDVFRRSDHVPAVVEDAIAAGAPALWLQLGISHPAAVSRAREAGMTVITDRCISMEHRRLAA